MLGKPKQGDVNAAGPLRAALEECRDLLKAALLFGCGVNVLYLAPSLFMLQVYDRVLLTGGLLTLLFIGMALLFALCTLAFLDLLRSRLMARLSLRLERIAAPKLLEASLRRGQKVEEPEKLALLRDFDTLRQTLSGPAAAAVMDAPWAPIFLIVCAIIHPILGLAVAAGGALLFLITLVAERSQRKVIKEASEAAPRVYAAQEADSASAGTIRALGMREVMIERQMKNRASLNEIQMKSMFGSFGYSSATKLLRLVLQSAVLGIGAWLAVERQISPGAMIAASILSSRALAPLEQIVATWRQIAQARNTYIQIDAALAETAATPQQRTQLPAPKGKITLERVGVRMAGADKPAVNDVSFECAAGEVLGVIGPSGAGKSTLARVIAGAIAPTVGVARMDGANYQDWAGDTLGRHVGYLPQDLHLLAGSIADNIRRFAPRDASNQADMDAAIIAAAQAAGAHDMVARLPHGYDTVLGLGGAGLSLGQAQRVALARALFRDPALLVLDEPNAHLDEEGENALIAAIRAAKTRGATVILVAHRAGILAPADRLLVMVDGRMQMIGAPDEVVRRQSQARANAPAPAPSASPIRIAQP